MTIQELLKQADQYREKLSQLNDEQQKKITEAFCFKLADSIGCQKNSAVILYIKDKIGIDMNITEEMINRIHFLLQEGSEVQMAGQYRMIQIPGSNSHQPPAAEDLPHLMEHFISQMSISKKMFHPIEFAVMCYKRIMDMLPFAEANDKVALVLMNCILWNEGYGIVSIPSSRFNEFQTVLSDAQKVGYPDIDGFISFITNRVIEMEQEIYELICH